MNSYLSKIAVRSAETKQGGRQGGFISPAIRATDDIADIVQKDPPTDVGHNFAGPELIAPAQPAQFPNAAPKIESAGYDFSETQARFPGENKPSSYLNDLANRDRTSGPFEKSVQDNRITGRDDFPDTTNQEMKQSFDDIAERPKAKATIQPAEIVSEQKPASKRNEAGVQDFSFEETASADSVKKTAIKQPELIEPQQKADWPYLKTSQKELARDFNPVENKVANQQAGRKNNGQKLVIGKITVEVLPAQPAPVKTPQSVNTRPPNNVNNKINNAHKLSYGLGQL